MKRGDVICPECHGGFRRIELASRPGAKGEFRCPLCHHLLEVSDGSTDIAYRLTVAPEKLFE
jgi:hypothetical protein